MNETKPTISDLPSYTWEGLRDELSQKDLLHNLLSHLISVTQHAAEERLRYLGKRMTGTNIERFAEDERARFALNVQAYRQNRVTLTADDILNRPRHFLSAWAVAEKLEGR